MPRGIAVKENAPRPRVESITVEIERELALALVIICNKVGGSPEGIRGLFSDGRGDDESLDYILREALGREGSWATDQLEKNLGSTLELSSDPMGSLWFKEIEA